MNEIEWSPAKFCLELMQMQCVPDALLLFCNSRYSSQFLQKRLLWNTIAKYKEALVEKITDIPQNHWCAFIVLLTG